jgi:hypothetical protein
VAELTRAFGKYGPLVVALHLINTIVKIVPAAALLLTIGGCSESDEITAYPAYCANGQAILPLGIAYRQFGEDYPKAMQDAERTCAIVTQASHTYRLNRARAEVTYVMSMGPGKLVNCTIFSSTDWACEYPDYASGIYKDRPFSGKVVFIKGRPAIHEKEAMGPEYSHRFYMHRWQWWTARLLSLFVWPVRSEWLIPEQNEHYS